MATALQNIYSSSVGKSYPSLHRTCLARSLGDQNEDAVETASDQLRSPAQQFQPLASAFRRRLLVGVGSASAVAFGANFGGVTSSILGLTPQTGRNLKLDVLYPIQGYRRCIEPNEGFEFIYPASWVGDQTLLYRAVGKAELERSLDPPSLHDTKRKKPTNEPIVGFGPPGSRGELNVSVIVSPVPLDLRIEAFGTPKEVGEVILRTFTGFGRRSNLKATLLQSNLREDPVRQINYYELEFRVDNPSFKRHNIAVCCGRGGRLYTLNAQAPESIWPVVKQDFYTISNSFNLSS